MKNLAIHNHKQINGYVFQNKHCSKKKEKCDAPNPGGHFFFHSVNEQYPRTVSMTGSSNSVQHSTLFTIGQVCVHVVASVLCTWSHALSRAHSRLYGTRSIATGARAHAHA